MMMKRSKGITLIALVITVIVLLILAGVSMATLTGKNGVIEKAETAKEENQKKEYEEALKIIGNGLRPDQTINNWDGKKYLDKFEDEIPKDQRLREAEKIRKNDIVLIVITKEGYAYKITEDTIKYIGKKGETESPKLDESNITFSYEPSMKEWTNKDVQVTIQSETEEYSLQFSTDGENWSDYKSDFTMTRNGPVYGRLLDDFGTVVCLREGEVKNIDKIPPEGEYEITETGRSWIQIKVNSETAEDPARDGSRSSGIGGVYFSINRWKHLF